MHQITLRFRYRADALEFLRMLDMVDGEVRLCFGTEESHVYKVDHWSAQPQEVRHDI